MSLVPITCYRCTKCHRLYDSLPKRCVCERQVYVQGERFGSFIVEGEGDDGKLRVRCILCDTLTQIAPMNIRKQQSCGCKAKSANVLEINEEILVYRCRKCDKVTTVRLPVVSYCCEGDENE